MPNNNELNPLTGLPVGTKVDAKDIKLPSSVTGNIGNASQDELLTTDPMSKYTDRGIDVVPNTNLREKLADSQGFLEQAKNGVVGGILSGLATAVQDFSYVPQLFSSHWEENAVSDAMIRAKEGIDEVLPIYTKTDGLFDWNDGAFVWKALKGTLDSAVGFGLPGGVMGKGLGMLGKAAKLEKGIQGLGKLATLAKMEKLGDLLSKSPKVYEAMMSLGTGYVMNRMEGTMMGVELYNKSMKELEGDIALGKITQAEAERIAAQKADEFRNWNTIFAITDAIGVHGIIKGDGYTRNIKNKGWGLTEMSMENPILQAIKESGDEIGQNIFQSEKEYETYRDLGLKGKAEALSNKKDLIGRIVDFGTSQQALYEGMLGLVGGYPQHLFSKVVSGAYTEKGKAKEEDYYNAQQKTIADTDAYLKNFNDINLKYAELKADALKRGDTKAVEALDKLSFTNIAIKNFTNGTTEHLERSLDDIINLSPEQAKERGYGPGYSSKAQSLKKEMLALENDWLHTSKYINHEEVFLTKQTAKVHQMLYNNELEKSQAKENEVNLEAGRLVQKYNAKIAKDLGHDTLGLSFDLNTMENPALSSELVRPYYNEMIAELKGTPAYDEYFSHKTSDLETTKQALDNVNNHYKTITSSKYQEAVQSLSDTIKEKQKEAKAKTKKDEAKAKHKETVAKVKEKVKVEPAVVTPNVPVVSSQTSSLDTPVSIGSAQIEDEVVSTPKSREDLYTELEDLYNIHDGLLQSSNPDQSKLAEISAQIQKLESQINDVENTEVTSQDNNISTSKEELEAQLAEANERADIADQTGNVEEFEAAQEEIQFLTKQLKALEELTPTEEVVVLQTDAQQEEVTSNEISQQEYTDDTNEDVEETNVATENFVEKEGLEEEEYYKSEFGSNILAYLSRLFKGFTSREDIDNVLNTELKDKSILDPNKFQPGTRITLQVKDNDDVPMYIPGTKELTTWGAYKIANSITNPADTERRRQEELNAQNSRIEEEKNKLEQKAKKKKTIIEWFTRDGKPSPPSPNGIYIEEIDNWHREQGHISRTREVENLTEGEVNKELKAIESGNQWKISQINAKYDAELDAYTNLVPIVILDKDGNEIADLHNTDWIRTENIFGDVQKDSVRLNKIRKHILANGGKIDSIITRKTNGKLFKLINGAKETIAKAFPDKNLHIVYSNKGTLRNVPTKIAEATSMEYVKDGITYIVVPVNHNSYVPLPLQQKKVSSEIAKSISKAISIWYKSKGVSSNLEASDRAIVDAIYAETDLDITKSEGLRNYVTLFINSYDIPAEVEAKIPKDSKESKLKIYLEGTSVKSTTHLLSVKGNSVDFGTGAKFTGSLSHVTPENVANDLISKLTSHLENMYLHINHSLLTKNNVKMHIINEDGTLSDINNNGSYKDFVRNNTETKYLSHNIGTEENPNYVYTIQPVIEYDTSFVDDANTRIGNELQAERNGTKTEITKANENIARIINPLTGEEIDTSKNNDEDEDFLPLSNNKLIGFLEQYGFEIEEAESLIIKLAEKKISLNSSDILQISKALSEPLAEMLSYSDYFYDIEKAIRDSEYYKKRLEVVAKENEGTKRNNRRLVTKEIFKNLLEKGFNEKLAKQYNIEKSLLDKIKNFIQDLINKLKDADWDTINKNISKIVENTFENKDFIRLTKKEGYKQVDFQKAFDENQIAKDIMTKIGTNPNIVLTGSIAYSTQGTVYRKIETVVHDLDFVNNGLSEEEINNLVLSNYPEAIKAYSFFDKYNVDTFLIPPKGIKITDLVRRSTSKIISYNLRNANNEIVGTYKLNFSTSGDADTGRAYNETEVKTGVEAMLVDFFSNDKLERDNISHTFIGSDNKPHTVYLSKFDKPFEAKLRYSRFKDIWDYNRFIPNKEIKSDDLPLTQNQIDYVLKSVSILQSDKAKQIFAKGEKSNWDLNKILTELQIPREQKDLILNLKKSDREQIALELASNYSYAVEINTAKIKNSEKREFNSGTGVIEKDGKYFMSDPDVGEWNEISKEAYDEYIKESTDTTLNNTNYYSNLSAPGDIGKNKYEDNPDWEYHELEFKTPLITPSIKGHAQFATNNGIGWARVWYNKKTGAVEVQEIQSDLFQKGRDKNRLVIGEKIYSNPKRPELGLGEIVSRYDDGTVDVRYDNGFDSEIKLSELIIPVKENQFLQLLNKDNNWVTFFVKSIVQDSAKKGYEKVLFPTGNTASKVEGHSTLEEFKKQKEDRIKELEQKIETFHAKKYEEVYKEGNKRPGSYPAVGYTKEEAKELYEKVYNNEIGKTINEINQLKQELERVETEGFGALKPIYNFYENTVTNVLKKQGYSPVVITDEHGNTWNEVTVDSNKNYTVDLLPLTDEQASTVVNSFKNTILVPGLTANQQQEIVNDIAYLLQRKVLEANGKTINGRDVHAEYKAYLESLLAITTGKRKEVIQAVIDNYKSIENISYKYFSKLQGVQVKENVDNLFSKGEEDTKVNVDEETDIANETESNLEKTTFEDSSLTQNYKNTISSRLKKFLSFIKTGEKNFVYSPKFVPFDEVYNTLKQVLSGERPDFDGMVKELEKNIISKPWLQDVVTQLNAAPGETKNDFVSAMTSHTVNMTFLMWQKDANGNYKLTPYSSNSVSISNMVVDNWYETGKLASVVIDKEGELVYNPEVVAKYKVAVQNLRDKKLEDITVTDVANTLAIVGIELHPDAVKMFLNKGLSGQSFKSHLISKTGIFANLSNKLSSTNDIVTDNYLGDKSITKLAYLEAKFNKNVTDSSFKSGTKSISAHTLNKHITNQVRELKNNRKLVTDLLSISFSKDSSLLKGLVFTEVTEDVKNEAEKVTGSREVTVNEQGVVIASDGQVIYNKDSYFYQNFNFDYLGIEAIKEFGKSSKEGSELKNISAAEHELIKIGLFMKSSLTQDSKGTRVAQMFYPTMSDKTTMINITTILHNISFTPDGALGNKTIDALFEALVLPEYNRMVNYKKTNVKGYDEGHALFYFLPQLNDRKELFHEDGTIKDLTSDKDALIIIKNEIRSTVEELVQGKLAEWETYQFTKDAYLDADYMKNTAKKNIKYAATDYVVNYLIHNSNMFQSFIGDPALYFKSNSKDNITKIEDTFINIGKRLAGDIAPGYELNNAYKDTFKAVVIADRKSVSESIEYYNKVLTEQGAKDYTKIEAGDAQEYTTLREHLKVMYGLGKITEKEFNRINKLAEEGKDLSDADLAVILQPMKPVYVANKIELHNDLNRRIYIKSSSFPLVPQLTRGLQIDNLRIAMEHPTKGVDRVSFGTAAKVGAPSNQLNIFDANGDFKTDINFDETEVLTLSRSGFRIQQEVPYDKEKINVGTQERKLLFVNLLDTPGFNYKDKKNLTGKQLQEIYTDKYHKLFQLQHKSLMEELEFNESTGKVNTSKLQKLLKKEAIERDFPINDLLGLELDRNGEFRIPLWLLPSTSRYESLLNAIVDNRVRKMKFNGGSFILGSEEGFKEKTTIVTDKEAEIELEKYHSDIVFTDSWTGKLKGTTETGMTQALIPFKFRDSKGELLDIANYTIKKDGKLVLNTDKLPKDLLKIFGFRIPTQGLNSMAQIEIVGFLPVSAGDLIITSKDFTKQMGSDFDVDKLYSYIYSHFTDSFGTIHKITTDNISKLLDLSQIKDDKKENLTKWIIGLYDALEIDYTEEDLKDPNLSKLKGKLEQLALHNEILDIHHAVLENTHEDVRKQMLTPLGFGDLKDGKDLANLIASWKKARSGTQSFNGLSDSYQKQKFLNATDGKGGTGVFSLDSVFNSLVQDKDLHYIIADADDFNTFSVKFGTLESTGFLSDPKTLDGKKYKSDVIAAYQSASVDNEKEQILDKLNINSNTYDTIRILAQLGFDEETISAFTNQDIIVDFVKEIKLQKSSLYGYQPDLEATIIEQLTKKYTEGIDTKSESFINAVIAKKNISTEELMSYIQNGNTNDTFGYAAAQIAALSKFKQLTEYGKTLKRIQSAINTDSAGLGKSLFASIAKEDSIRNLQNSPVKNAEKLIGNYTIVNGKLEIEPTTINGFATVYGLFTNNALWSKYFPYGHENITNIVTEINKVTSDKEMDTAQKEEVYKNVFGAIKSYLFTRKDLGIFDGDLKARREWLFKNLGKRISEFKINKVKLFETNPFLNKLTTETDLKSGLKILKYNAVSLESFFEDSIYGGFLDLIQKNTEIADGYTTRQLADDLVQYAYLSGGKQQAVDFIRYIPIEYLNQLPFANKLRNINFSDTNVLDNIQRSDKVPYYQVSEFVKQYVQHNSRKAPEFPVNTKVEYTNKEKTQFTLAKDAITLSKMPVFVNFNDKLWQFNGQNYTQISKLGGKYQIGEYDANSRGITSIISKQNPKQLVTIKVDGSNSIVENTAKKPYEDVIVARNRKYMLESGSILNVLDAITNLSTNPAYKRLASEYYDVISKLDYKIDIKLSNVNAYGRASYNKNGKGNVLIEINNSNAIDSVKFLEKVILHETTHALTKFLIVADKDTLTTQQKEIVEKLDKFRNAYKQRVNAKLVDFVQAKVKNKESLTDFEQNILYPGINLEEFTAAAMENEEFQKFLAKEIWQGDKTMLDKFFELMKDLMKSLGINVGEDLNKYIYSDVLNLIKSQVKETPTQAVDNNQISYYEGNIKPDANTIFVFGSNPEGRHGKGAALIAVKQFGAKYGQGEGLQGNAYALPTKDLRVKENSGFKSISPTQITESIKKLYQVAKENPTKQFKIGYRNTTDKSLNGYTGLEMIDMFNNAGERPSNIIFSKEWIDTGKVNKTADKNQLQKQNIFTVKPIQSADKKAVVKASVANKFIGFGEGIANSSTELYRKQAGEFANVGNYNSNDIVFVSIGGKRGDVTLRKEQQDKTIKEALKAIEAGATLITDNKSYVESSDYNEGEKRLAKNLEAKGYNYSEQIIDGQVLGVWNKNISQVVDKNIKGENITSKGSEFAKKLTNVGNSVGLTYKGKEYVNSEHAYQTWKSGEFNQAGYNLKGGKVRGGKIGDTFSIMTDILTEKLKQHPDLAQGINERGGLEYLQKSTHNVIGDKFWESTGQNKFIEALIQAYKNISQVVDSGIDAKTLKRGDIIEFQQQNFQIERVTEEGFDVRDVNTGEVDFITKEDYESENKKEIQPDIEETLEHFLPINNKFSKNTLELTKNVLSLFETEDTIENYKNRCK